jgi:hypothetical protein
MNTKMAKTTEESNRPLVLEAIDTPFNKRDYKAAAERFVGRRVQARCAR